MKVRVLLLFTSQCVSIAAGLGCCFLGNALSFGSGLGSRITTHKSPGCDYSNS